MNCKRCIPVISVIIIFILSLSSTQSIPDDSEDIPVEKISVVNERTAHDPDISFEKGPRIMKPEKPEKSKLSNRNYNYKAAGKHQVFFNDLSISGNLLEFDYAGDYVIISPILIQYMNSSHSGPVSLVSVPVVQAKDNSIIYKNIFGGGIDLIFENNDNQLKENLIIKDPSNLPQTGGLTGDIYLAYTGWMDHSDELDLFINGEQYLSGRERTGGRIEFRKNGTTIFYFESPVAYDSLGEEIGIEYIVHDTISYDDNKALHRNNSLFWTVLVPYEWLNETVTFEYNRTRWVNGTWNGTAWENGIQMNETAYGYAPVRKYPITIDPTISYDFQFPGTAAWDYGGSSAPAPTSGLWIPATSTSRDAISTLDSKIWRTRRTTGHDQYDYQLYRFRLNHSIPVLDILVNWTGFGENTTGYNTSINIWNFTSQSYELIDSSLLASEGVMRGNRSNEGQYVSSTRDIYVLASAKHYNYAPPTPTGLSAAVGTTFVTISWAPVVDPDGDGVEYYVQIDGFGNSGWINATSWYTAGLRSEKTYTYRVRSRDTFANFLSDWAVGTFRTLRDYGSCPFVYIWNGTGYEYYTDIAGGVINIPKKTVGFYNSSYIDLKNIVPVNNTYKVKFREVIDEIDYVDQMSLLVVDHPGNVQIVSSGAEKRPWEEVPFEIYTIKKPIGPVNAVYMNGSIITGDIISLDGRVAPADFYNDDYITLDFGKVQQPSRAKLIIDGWTFFDESMRKGMVIDENVWPYIEVMNAGGNWIKVKEFGYFTGDQKTMVINLSGVFLSNDPRIRIHTGRFAGHSEIIIDRIRLDTSPPEPVSIQEVPVAYSHLHYAGGATLKYQNMTNRIQALDDFLMDEPKPYYGNFTRYGIVTPLLDSVDDRYVIMRHGDELSLEFTLADTEPAGKKRTPVLKTFLWFKVLSPKNPEPLPFASMTRYPYDASIENYPQDEFHKKYLEQWNTREYLPPTISLDDVTGPSQDNSLNTNYVNIFLTMSGGNTYWRNQGSSAASVLLGSPLNLFTEAKDDYCLESATLATNETGDWKNITGFYGSPILTGCTENWTWTNFTWTNISIPPGTNVGWRIYYANNLGPSNVTGTKTFTVEEAVPPRWRNQGSSADSVLKGGTISLYAQGLDDYCLTSATLMTNESGTWKNISIINIGCLTNNWTWTNFTWTNGSVIAGKTVEWKICYRDIAGVENCTGIKNFSVKNVLTWTRPSEYMVNPPGWGGPAAPAGYRTLNITSVPLPISGYFIRGLSPLEARIYDPAGGLIGTSTLTGDGPYYGGFLLNDSIPAGWYTINITAHPDLGGLFYVLRWSCRDCHSDSGRYPTSFNNTTAHTRHTNTQHSTGCNSCHQGSTHATVRNILPHAYKRNNCECHPNGNSAHISYQRCSNRCHKSQALGCNECHNDISNSSDTKNTSILSTGYGRDIHLRNVSCTDCHGPLPAPSPAPSCPTCHPLPGSNLTGLQVPGFLDSFTHSPRQRVPCGSCHNVEHSIRPMSYTIDDCKQCHRDVIHNEGRECSACHGQDPHNVTPGAGPDCVFCHDVGGRAPPDKHINVSAMKLGIHRNLNNGTPNSTVLTDPIDKACWACHGNGSEPLGGHPDNYRTPFNCYDCHTTTGTVTMTAFASESITPGEQEACVECHPQDSAVTMALTSAAISAVPSGLKTRIIYEHIPAPYREHISSTGISKDANCTGCHNRSKVPYTDSGFSMDANVSHYASLTDLVQPSINCNLCHKDEINATAYWAKTIRHPARTGDVSFCRNCHNTTLALDLHSRSLVRPGNVHIWFDWGNDDHIQSPDPNEGCKSCHSAHGSLVKPICESCHLKNGSGPINYSGELRPDINDTMPRVYAHTNFSSAINVPDQSTIAGKSTCFAFNTSSLAGTCHGIAYNNRAISGGYFAFRGTSVSSPYHITYTVDWMPDTLDCLFCHNQTNSTIRTAWGGSVQITGGTHDWYTGNNVSRCYSCHSSPGTWLKDFHSDNLTAGGGPDCIYCHDIGTTFSTHSIDVGIFNNSVHANMNNEAEVLEGYSKTNGACWACHDSNGSNISGMGDRFNDPYICADCHLRSGIRSGAYGAAIVYNHYSNGSTVTALDNISTDMHSCIECHENVSIMVISNNDTDTGSFIGDGLRETGGNSSFYHYGRNMSSLGGSRYGYCSYCHNSSSGEFFGVFQDIENTSILNHSLQNSSSLPICDNRFCHNSTNNRIHDLNFTIPELTTTAAGGPDSRICLLCHNTYYLQEAPGTGMQVKHFSLNCSECHLYLPRDIHGIKYLQKDGKYNTSVDISTVANCMDCHVIRTIVQPNISIPIPEVIHPRSL